MSASLNNGCMAPTLEEVRKELLLIEQTRSPFDMSISKSKYDTTFLDYDISETTSSSWQVSLRNCLNIGLLILMRSST